MRILIIAIAFGAVCLAVYQIIPYLLGNFARRMRIFKTGKTINEKEIVGENSWLADWYLRETERAAAKLRRAGFVSARSGAIYINAICLGFIAALAIGIIGIHPLINSVLLAIVLFCLANSWITGKIKARQKAFNKALYKIYHFLDMQISSGVSITDAIKGICESVNEKQVRPSLLKFSAAYELTLDLDAALKELQRDFSGPEYEILAGHLHQCLQTGQTGRSLRRMEDLMFTRYFNLLQEETRRLRNTLFWLSLPALGSFMIIMIYPLIYSAFQAWTSVFG